MNKTKLCISTYVMTAVLLILGVIDSLTQSSTIFTIGNLAGPILAVATIVCAYLAYKESTAFKSKWVWVALSMHFIHTLSAIAYLPYGIFGAKAKFIYILAGVIWAAGCCIILISLLCERLIKIMPIGFGAMALNSIVLFFANDLDFASLLEAVMFAGFILLSLNVLPKLRKVIRWIIVALALITASLELSLSIQWIVLAFLMVPAEKIKLNFSKLVAILCIVTAILTVVTVYNSEPFVGIEYYNENVDQAKNIVDEFKTDLKELKNSADEYSEDYFEELINEAEERLDVYKKNLSDLRDVRAGIILRVIVILIAVALAVAFLICQAICLFRSSFGKLNYVSYALMAASAMLFTVLSTSSNAFWNFDILNYPIFSFITTAHFWTVAVIVTLAVILSKNGVRVKRFRVLAIVFAAIILLCSLGDISVVVMGGELSFMTYILFAVTMICISLVLVPLTFTEYNNVAKHIFFSIITLGVWMLIWIYNVTKNLNKVSSVDARKPVAELLLCMFVPLYSVYWLYKTAEYTEAYGAENGKEFKIDILSLAFAVISPIISTIIIQDKINRIVGKPE